MTPSREQILEINSEQEDLARIGISDASDVATVTIAGDDLAPAVPSNESAGQIPGGILVEWLNPSLNADSSPCVDQRWAKIYYQSSSGVSKSSYDGTVVIAASPGTNSAFNDTVSVAVARYYVITALDASGNESAESGEVDSTGGGVGTIVDIPDDSSGLVFDDAKGTEGVVVGDGVLGIAFKQPASTWSGFDHYRLWFAVDTNGGFGGWTEIAPTNRIGYLHKGLTKTSSYRYKATIVSVDGTESSTADKAKSDDSGYAPNGSANNLLIAELIFAENLICVNEVRGEHFFAQSYLAINDDTFGNDGIQLEYNSGNPRAYIGDGSSAFLNFDGTKLTWKAANTELDASGNLTASSATFSGSITSTSGTIGGFTIGATTLVGGTTNIILDSSNKKISINSATFGADGIQLDYNSGNPRFYVGDGSNAYVNFDGTKITWKAANTELDASGNLVASSVTLTGAITATSGTIAGFTVHATDGLYAGATTTRVQMKPGAGFWAGATAQASAPFRVSAAGALVATSATITGTITSGAVTITGGTLNINSGVFSVSAAGALVATSATITGAITSSSVTITGGTLNINSGVFTVSAAGAVTCSNISCTNLTVGAGSEWGGDAIDGDSYLTCTNLAAINADIGTITAGKINLQSGKIEIGEDVDTSQMDGIVIYEGANPRVRIGEWLGADEYGIWLYDNDGNLQAQLAGSDSYIKGAIIEDIDASTITTGTLSASYISAGTLDCSLMTVSNLSASSISAGTLSANYISGGTLNCGLMTVSNLSASSINAGTLSASYISSGTLNCSLMTVSNLNAGSITAGTLSVDRLAAGSITYGKMAANSVRTSELYIDDDLTFSPGAEWHQIINCQGIQGYDAAHAVYFGTGSTSDVIVQARTLLYMFLDHSAYSIEFSVAAAGNTLELFELTNTGGAQGSAAGRIKVEANGTVRYIRLYT